MPKDLRVEISADWDNSANNPLNPDPTKSIRWGAQNWDEMLVGFGGAIVNRDADPDTLITRPKPSAKANALATRVPWKQSNSPRIRRP